VSSVIPTIQVAATAGILEYTARAAAMLPGSFAKPS